MKNGKFVKTGVHIVAHNIHVDIEKIDNSNDMIW